MNKECECGVIVCSEIPDDLKLEVWGTDTLLILFSVMMEWPVIFGEQISVVLEFVRLVE